MLSLLRPLIALIALVALLPAAAAPTRAAVASNFSAAASALKDRFEAQGGEPVELVFGSTGKLYAQIVQGAPFDLLLAADQARPAQLEASGLAVAGSRFTYARGRLALWSRDAAAISADGPATLAAGQFRRLAIANPRLAPYGLAAQQTLEKLGLWDSLAARLVRGENVGQTFAMIASGNAELGFVPTNLIQPGVGSRWDVPAELHEPIRQDAVLLTRARDSAAARAFLAFLASADGRETAIAFGYETD